MTRGGEKGRREEEGKTLQSNYPSFLFFQFPCRSKKYMVVPLSIRKKGMHTCWLRGRSSPEFRRDKEGKSEFETTILEGEDYSWRHVGKNSNLRSPRRLENYLESTFVVGRHLNSRRRREAVYRGTSVGATFYISIHVACTCAILTFRRYIFPRLCREIRCKRDGPPPAPLKIECRSFHYSWYCYLLRRSC